MNRNLFSQPMRRFSVLLSLIVLLAAGSLPSAAQEPPPRGRDQPGLEAPRQSLDPAAEPAPPPPTSFLNSADAASADASAEAVLATAIQVVAGEDHTCALTSGGGVKCWGRNYWGQLGDATTTDRLTPVAVSGLGSGAAALAAGDYHTCALTASGGVKCWGWNSSGQLGDGTTTDRLTPVTVSGLASGVAALAAGFAHTCALTSGGGVKCWGYNFQGQLGNGGWTRRLTPVAVSGLGSGAAALAAGEEHTCAVTSGGGVKCWGDNQYGQLGDGTRTDRNTPVAVSGLPGGVTALAAGMGHTCALTSGGGVKCWGSNGWGQLGDGTTTEHRLTPVAVSGLGSGAVALAAGDYHTCALMAGGGVKCWGWNQYGQLGDGTTAKRLTPVAVSGLASGAAALAAGEDHTCALTAGGGVKCWGGNPWGQLGDGTRTNRTTPVDVVGFGAVPTYTISGRVTEAGGFTGIPGVIVWADTTRSTITDANGNYSFTGLPAGTYSVRPSLAPYAFSPASRAITVPANQTNVNFRKVVIDKVQVNQVLGNTSNYVAGKDTVIQVIMSDYVSYDQANQQVVVKRDGTYVTTLKPIRPAFPTQILNFWGKMADCEDWQQGSYTFEAIVNGSQMIQSAVSFSERRSLRILAVPVKIKVNGQVLVPSDRWKSAEEFVRRTYPVADKGILYQPADKMLDATLWDLTTDGGRIALFLRLSLYQPVSCTLGLGACYDAIFGIIPQAQLCPSPPCTEGWTSWPPAAVVMDKENLPAIMAHELGHMVGYDHLFVLPGLGDEYSGLCGVFQCDDNPPPQNYLGKTSTYGSCSQHCSDATVQPWDDWKGSAVLPEDDPFEVGGRRGLGKKLSFMGASGENQSEYWITPNAYNSLFNQLTRRAGTAATMAIERVVDVRGWVQKDERGGLAPAYYLDAVIPAVNAGPYSIEVLDAGGAILSIQGFDVSFLLLSNPPQELDQAYFRVAVPFPRGAQTLRLKHGATVLAQTTVSAHAPTISLTSPTGGQTWAATGNYTIRWQGSDLDGDILHYTVLYRQGEGDWSVLGADLTANELTVDAAGLPGGTSAQVQVLATDGINTTTAESDLFTVGRKPPEVFITYPAEGASFMPGALFFLQGTAYDLEDGTLPDPAYHWTSNRDGDLGTGATNLVILSPGLHVITLTVTDSDGNTAVKTIRISAGSQQFMPLIRR